MLDFETLKDAIKIKNVKIISFDIFDTLIVRPCMYPLDIMVLLNDKVKEIVGKDIDFYAIRKSLENNATEYYQKKNKQKGVTFDQIYSYFQDRYHFTYDHVEKIKNLEQELELDLCSKRELAYELYNIAVSANKRIICVSDMYYESNFLNKLLQKNGYNKISKIYVSSEIGARKDTGDLYDYLLSQENVKPYEILHIGDNEQSDFLIPLSKGIIAFHLPNNKDLCITKKETFQKIWANPENYTPYERIIIGYTINKWTENIIGSTPQNLFGTKEEMGYFGIGPVLFSIAQILCTNSEIQTNYQVIHFASRDGYLPLKGYELLRTTVYNN